MIYGSVCSGIEAATVAWHPLGWKPAFFAEIEKHPCSVLKHHYPDVPNLGDMTKFKEWPDYAIDLLIGGTPCQSFSVAGLRKGLADPRGNLALTYLAIVDRYRPEWCVWENVPGVLSSGGGRDFGSFLGGLAELGYGFAYRVLDAQFIRVESHPRAVPQRRRRVIVVGHSGDWRRAAAVLFERESLSGHSPPRREARERVAGTIEASLGRSRGSGQSTSALTEWPADVAPTLHTSWADRSPGSQAQEWDSQKGGHFVPEVWPAEVASTLNAAFGDKQGLEDQHAMNGAPLFVPGVVGALTAKGPEAMGAPEVDGGHYIISSGQANATVNKDIAPALDCLHEAPIVAHTLRAEHDATEDGTGRGTPLVPVAFDAKGSQVQTDEPGAALTLRSMNSVDSHDSGGGHMAVAFQPRFARNGRGAPDTVAAALTSEAGETGKGDSAQCVVTQMAVRRLTPVECCRLQGFPDDYLDCLKSDGPKYKALGNSMATNVIRWIGDRIETVRKI